MTFEYWLCARDPFCLITALQPLSMGSSTVSTCTHTNESLLPVLATSRKEHKKINFSKKLHKKLLLPFPSTLFFKMQRQEMGLRTTTRVEVGL